MRMKAGEIVFLQERLDKIEELLLIEGKVLVRDLSEQFKVSESMIRKDLQMLEKQGRLKRTYGGAISIRPLVHDQGVNTRMHHDLDKKELIAKRAIPFINEGEVIFLDISSTNFALAKQLSKLNKRLTIVTNMIEIPPLFSANIFVEVIMVGGQYNATLGGMIGALANEQIAMCKFDKSFIGVGGINVDENFISNFNAEESITKKTIIKSSKEVFVLIENEKFNRDGSYQFATLQDITHLMTDAKLEGRIKEKLEQTGLNISCE